MVAFASKAVLALTAMAALSPLSAATPGPKTQPLAAEVVTAFGGDAATWISKNGATAHDKLVPILKRILPNATDEVVYKAVETEIRYEANSQYQENVKLYSTHFTDEQLKDILTFYRSQGGRAFVAQVASMNQERGDASRQVTIDLVRRMVDSACAGQATCR